MKKFLIIFSLLFVLSVSLYAADNEYKKSELGIGFSCYCLDKPSSDKFSAFVNIFGEYNRYLGPDYYIGNRVGILVSEEATTNSDESLKTGSFFGGFCEQITLGIKKDLVGDDTFKISPFAEISAGVVLSPVGLGVQTYDDYCEVEVEGDNETSAKFIATPQAGLAIRLGFLQTKIFWTTNYVSDLGFLSQAVGMSASIRW